MFKKKIKLRLGQKGLSLLELMLAMVLGIIVIMFVLTASFSLYRNSLQTKAIFDIQDTMSFTRHIVGNAIKQTYSAPCNSFIGQKNKERIELLGGDIAGIDNDYMIYGLYVGRAGQDDLQVNFTNPGLGRLSITEYLPTVGNGPNQILPNTDYFVSFKSGSRLLANYIYDDRKRISVSKMSVNDITTFFPSDISKPRTGIAMISDCEMTQLGNATHDIDKVPNGESRIIFEDKVMDSFYSGDVYITPVSYSLYFIGRDKKGNIGLRTKNLLNINEVAQTLVGGILDMQIKASVLSKTSGRLTQSLYATVPNIKVPRTDYEYNYFQDLIDIENIQTLYITYTIGANDAGIFSIKNNEEDSELSKDNTKVFTESYVLRNISNIF